jgi:hypothetical protein
MAQNKKNIEIKTLPNLNTAAFTAIAFCLTIISAYNGFKFYNTLFGLFLAVVISATFETSRLACLFRYRNSEKRIGFLTLILYAITAIVCAFASINSFTSEVIRRNRLNENVFQEQIYNIKKTFSEIAAKKISELNKNIEYLQNQTAKYPNSNYWKRKLSLYITNRDNEIARRDEFLEINPKNPEQWIRAKSPLFGLEIKNLSGENEALISVKLALKEVWGLSDVSTKKIIGIVVTVTIELCILLFAILATEKRNQGNVVQEIVEKKNLLETLQADFGERPLKRFLKQVKNHYERTGKLLPLQKVTPNTRPIMKYLNQLDRESLEELIGK